MSSSALAPAETLIARKNPWRKRLWVRISVSLVLIALLMAFSWWWPRRGIVAVWWVNGYVGSDEDHQRASDALLWWDPSRRGWIWKPENFNFLFRLINATKTDNRINFVNLEEAQVDDQWLKRLQRFPKLKSLALHDRQFGTGMDHLSGLEELTYMQITSASGSALRELQRFPQLETLALYLPQADGLELTPLAQLPRLKTLSFSTFSQADRLLINLPELPGLEKLGLLDCTGFQDDDLSHLQQLPNLKILSIYESGPLNDRAIFQISQLKSLEYLLIRKSSGTITSDGLQALSQLSQLKEFGVSRGDFPQTELNQLQQRLPNTTIRAISE